MKYASQIRFEAVTGTGLVRMLVEHQTGAARTVEAAKLRYPQQGAMVGRPTNVENAALLNKAVEPLNALLSKLAGDPLAGDA